MRKKSKFFIKRTTNINEIKKLNDIIFPYDEMYSTNDTCYYWLVKSEGKNVGFCIVTLMDNNIAFLARSGLLVSARGNGLQKRMIKVRERFVRKAGFTKIITYTKLNNIKSAHNLQKCGYLIYTPDYEYADKDCIYWIKEFM